ncbi:MAG: tetratricopeptide repeat protein [Sarcina sp.]
MNNTKETKSYMNDQKNDIELKENFSHKDIIYDKQDEYEEVIAAYTKAIALNNKDKEAFNNRGTAYRKQREYEKAIVDYTKAIDLDDLYKEAFNNRGTTYRKQKKYEKAIADYTRAIALDNEYKEAFNNRGIAYSQQGDYKKAIDDYTEAIKLDDEYKEAFCSRGNAYYHQNEYNKAIVDYTRAIELDKEYDYPYLASINIYKIFSRETNNCEIQKKAQKIYNDYLNLLNERTFDNYIEKKLREVENPELKKDLQDLYTNVTKIKSRIKYQGNDDLGHYTNIQNLKWLVKREESFLRLNNIEYMNDPDEGYTFIKLFDSEKSKKLLDDIYILSQSDLEKRLEIKGEGNIFLSSLSKNIDNSLPMWRQYANDGDGCCLIFDSKFFEENSELDDILKLNIENGTDNDTDNLLKNIKMDGLYNVIYVDNGKSLDDIEVSKSITNINYNLESILDRINNVEQTSNYIKEISNKEEIYKIIREILDNIRFLFKDSTYAYEEEIRLVKFEDIEDKDNQNVKCTCENEGFLIPRLYVNSEKNIQLKEVILGPKVANERGISNYIRYTGRAHKVTKSKIRYK